MRKTHQTSAYAFGFVLMLGLAALATWVGLEGILGAFLAGLLFAYVFRETGVL